MSTGQTGQSKEYKTVVGDPVLDFGEGYMILTGYGDFRTPPMLAQQIILASKLLQATRVPEKGKTGGLDPLQELMEKLEKPLAV